MYKMDRLCDVYLSYICYHCSTKGAAMITKGAAMISRNNRNIWIIDFQLLTFNNPYIKYCLSVGMKKHELIHEL